MRALLLLSTLFIGLSVAFAFEEENRNLAGAQRPTCRGKLLQRIVDFEVDLQRKLTWCSKISIYFCFKN